MAISIELLKSIAYFSSLSFAELESIGQLVSEKSVDRNELILWEGEPSEALYFVAFGAVKVFKTSAEGKEQILYIIRPGESLNDVPVFDGGPNPTSAQAIGPVVLYQILKVDVESILQRYPKVAVNALKVLAQKVRQLMLLIEDLSFRHVIGRVARILLEYAGNGTDSRPRLTQQEMAAMVGTAREVVGRSLKALEEEGAIRMDRHRLVIVDKQVLREISGTPY